MDLPCQETREGAMAPSEITYQSKKIKLQFVAPTAAAASAQVSYTKLTVS